MLTSGRLVEDSPANLVAQVIGGTAIKTTEIFESTGSAAPSSSPTTPPRNSVTIAQQRCVKHDYRLDESASAVLLEHFEHPEDGTFGNGRTARKTSERMVDRQDSRLATASDMSTVAITRLLAEDLDFRTANAAAEPERFST